MGFYATTNVCLRVFGEKKIDRPCLILNNIDLLNKKISGLT